MNEKEQADYEAFVKRIRAGEFEKKDRKPKSEKQIIAEERRKEHEGERRYCRRYEY